MPTIQLSELPAQHFACRRLPATDDMDLCLAEAAALSLWAAQQGHTTTDSLWLALNADGSVEAAVPVDAEVTAGVTAEAGIAIRTAGSPTCRIAACEPALEAAHAAAEPLRAWPVSDHGRPLPDGWVWLRLRAGREPLRAVVHLPIHR